MREIEFFITVKMEQADLFSGGRARKAIEVLIEKYRVIALTKYQSNPGAAFVDIYHEGSSNILIWYGAGSDYFRVNVTHKFVDYDNPEKVHEVEFDKVVYFNVDGSYRKAEQDYP